MSLVVKWHQQWNANRSPQVFWTGLQWHSLVMGSLFGAEWSSLRTWPKMRKSNDLWPMSEPCCGRFHSSSLILHTNKCTAWSHRSSWGCFLEVPLRASEAQCLGCAEELLGETSTVPGPGIWKCRSSCVVSGGLPSPGCRNITDGQLDIHDAAFWCHPHATYASPCGYDFLEIAFSQSLTAVTMATQSQLLGKDFSMHTHTETQAHAPELKPSWSPKSPHAKHSKATVWVLYYQTYQYYKMLNIP